MESIIAVDMKSFLFSNNLISDHQFGFIPGLTPPWTCCFYFTNNGWRPSISVMILGSSPWTYLVLLIKSGILPYSPNSLPVASKANTTHGLLTSSNLLWTCSISIQSFNKIQPLVLELCSGQKMRMEGRKDGRKDGRMEGRRDNEAQTYSPPTGGVGD